MTVPTLRAVGAIASGTGTVSPGLPSGTVAGDLLLMFTECDQAETVTVSGWEHVPNSPQATATGTTDTKLSCFWKIAESASAATTTNDPGDHIVARIIGITVGTFRMPYPFDVAGCAGGTDETADTSASIPGGTTTIPDCLILMACSNGNDPASNGTANYGAMTNANLASINERIDNTRTDGNGGGLGVSSATLATPGAVGTTACTLAVASLKGMITIAIASTAPAIRVQPPRRWDI